MNAENSGLEGCLLQERHGAILMLALNRPQSRNRLSLELIVELHTALEAATDDDSVHVIVLGACGEVFCSDHEHDAAAVGDGNISALRQLWLASNDLMLALAACPKATIASVRGDVEGPGFEVVASCDLALAAHGARFRANGVNHGLWEHTAQVALSRTATRKHAMEILLTGSDFSAADAARMGLINHAVDDTELDAAVMRLAERIAAQSRYTVGLGKYSYQHQAGMEHADAYEFVCDQYLRDIRSTDAQEGLNARREGRPPRWTGR